MEILEQFFWAMVFCSSVIFGGFSGWLASEKNRESGSWFVLGFFFGPVALIALGFSPDLEPVAYKTSDTTTNGKKESLSISFKD